MTDKLNTIIKGFKNTLDTSELTDTEKNFVLAYLAKDTKGLNVFQFLTLYPLYENLLDEERFPKLYKAYKDSGKQMAIIYDEYNADDNLTYFKLPVLIENHRCYFLFELSLVQKLSLLGYLDVEDQRSKEDDKFLNEIEDRIEYGSRVCLEYEAELTEVDDIVYLAQKFLMDIEKVI